MRIFLSLLVLLISAPVLAEECVKPRISGPGIWPPYVMTSDTGTRTGMAIDTVNAVFGDLFGGVEMDRPKPWTRVQHDIRTGKIDVIYAILHQPDRARDLIFTNAWIDDIYAVVTVKGREFPYRSIEDLIEKSGGYLEGVRLPQPFGDFSQRKGTGLRPISNIDGLFKLPASGRLDYVIASLRPYFALRDARFPELEFSILEQSRINIPVYMAISKLSPCRHHLDEINERLKLTRKKLSLPM